MDNQSKNLKEWFKTSAELKDKLEIAKALAEKREDEEAQKFLQDFEERFEQYGSKTLLSEKQYKMLCTLAIAQAEDWVEDEETYKELLNAAKEMASDDWSENFVADQIELFEKYGMKARLTEKQKLQLEKIASGAAGKEVEKNW